MVFSQGILIFSMASREQTLKDLGSRGVHGAPSRALWARVRCGGRCGGEGRCTCLCGTAVTDDTQTDRQNRQTQTDRQTDRQTDTHTHTHRQNRSNPMDGQINDCMFDRLLYVQSLINSHTTRMYILCYHIISYHTVRHYFVLSHVTLYANFISLYVYT